MPPDPVVKTEPTSKPSAERQPAATETRSAPTPAPASSPTFDFDKMLSQVRQAQTSFADTEIRRVDSHVTGWSRNVNSTQAEIDSIGTFSFRRMSGERSTLVKTLAGEKEYLQNWEREAQKTRSNLQSSRDSLAQLEKKIAEFKKVEAELQTLRERGQNTDALAKRAEKLIEEMNTAYEGSLNPLNKLAKLDSSALQKVYTTD